MKRSILLLILLCSLQANSQKLNIGYSTEPLWSIIGRIPYPYSNLLFIEYSPTIAAFSILSGVNYYVGQHGIIIPLIFSPELSRDKRINISPEIGVSPLIYFQKSTIDRRLDLILQGSIRIEYKTKGRFIPFTSVGIQYFPSVYEVPNQWGEEVYQSVRKVIPYISIGLKYQLLYSSELDAN